MTTTQHRESFFSLVSFEGRTPEERIDVSVKRTDGQLRLTYSVPDELTRNLFATSMDHFRRVDELWKNNCLELFVGNDASSAYLEYNFSFFGEWNCYHFDDYRNGMRPEPAADLLSFRRIRGLNRLVFEIMVLMPPEAPQGITVCPTAILISEPSAATLHFAPAHLSDKPDFHLAGARVSMRRND